MKTKYRLVFSLAMIALCFTRNMADSSRLAEGIMLPASEDMLCSDAEVVFDADQIPDEGYCMAQVRLPEGIMLPQSEKLIRSDAEASFDADQVATEDANQQPSHWMVNPDFEYFTPFESELAQNVLHDLRRECSDVKFVHRLSLHGRALTGFLETGIHHSFDCMTMDVGLRMIFNAMKAALIFDDSVVLRWIPDLIEKLPSYLNTQQQAGKVIGCLQRELEQMMCDASSRNQDMMTRRPQDFLTRVSRSAARLCYKHFEGAETVIARRRLETDKLRDLVYRIIDLALSKVKWHPQAIESIWPSFLRIGADIMRLGEVGMVKNEDNLKDLMFTLVRSFGLFLNLYASSLPSEFFAQIQQDLQQGVVFFLEYEEYGDVREAFMQELEAATVKAIAYEQMGLLS